MWGRDIAQGYSDAVDFVGLCDTNSKRLEASKGIHRNFEEARQIAQRPSGCLGGSLRDRPSTRSPLRARRRGAARLKFL